MLKALELVGFKSFADKTRFEFARGITAVVGPNGSGKSNLVDAIKWVLGEQSVKSLRGKEMADVIFNGSGSRGPLNTAEVTLTFDNAAKTLPLDTPDVHVTRRVYRSGEGEYLINRQPCRLRDIRELFVGTGVGTEAYSVIEQGKVDVLLQSSPRERRMIFEEAAGISRFKAKKIECMRRLERVEQNLVRLSDIVGEIESRLRSVRMQASKARRYKEHLDRLRELRTQVALSDWHKLTSRADRLTAEIERLTQERSAASARADALEADATRLEGELAELEGTVRSEESRAAANREAITTREATIDHERGRSRDLEAELSRHRDLVVSMSVRAGDTRHQLDETLATIAEAAGRHRELDDKLTDQNRQLATISNQLDAARRAADAARVAYLATTRAAGVLASESSALESQIETGRTSADRSLRRLDELNRARSGLEVELVDLQRREQELATAVDQRQEELSMSQSKLAELRQQHAAQSSDLNQLRRRHAGASERAAVIEELENRSEGVGAGVKQVLEICQQEIGRLPSLLGLVADLLHANVESAPLVDLALGDRAQHLVVGSGQELTGFLESLAGQFKGRVGFIEIDGPRDRAPSADLSASPGVIDRADRLVDMAAELRPLAERLLGRTWIVEKLSDALDLRATAGAHVQFVTVAGELVTTDGTLSVGPKSATLGLISRRSELRALTQLLGELETRATTIEARVAELDGLVGQQDDLIDRQLNAHQRSLQGLTEHRLRVHALETRLTQFVEQASGLEAEIAAAETQVATAVTRLDGIRERRSELELRLSEQESDVAQLSARATELETDRHAFEEQLLAGKVERAKSEERLGNLESRRRQCERDQQERERSIADSRGQLEQCRARWLAAQRQILRIMPELAELYLAKEQIAAAIGALAVRQPASRQQRAQLVAQAQQSRAAVRALEESQHAQELEAQQVKLERTNLCDRLREDYGIELAEVTQQPSEAQLQERAAAEQEIADLRRKINHLGNVNLEALQELEELDARHAMLASQFDDLTKAKNHLEQIIARINTDSRKLFTTTLDAVKENFKTLFGKLFGGGQADIVLEEGVDILESGIEILARPPGKEPRNISLLSGGEKTLTCVALLLAIFQYRPSPFCVLDEVDAALDEANIERFIGVLQEFLTWTQFVVVTHSKKTMTCAATLYGITMQESGISKRVSVRFEDVSDDGEILATAGGSAGDDETQAA
jgi:chromosome segregation protein